MLIRNNRLLVSLELHNSHCIYFYYLVNTSTNWILWNRPPFFRKWPFIFCSIFLQYSPDLLSQIKSSSFTRGVFLNIRFLPIKIPVNQNIMRHALLVMHWCWYWYVLHKCYKKHGLIVLHTCTDTKVPCRVARHD